MLTLRDPWAAMREMERDVDTLFRRLLVGTGWVTPTAFRAPARLPRATWSPAVDVLNRNGDLVIRAELPGVDPEKDVEIFVEDGALHLRGERRTEQRQEGDSYLSVESSFGSFDRVFALPQGVDADAISATYENGVLEVVIPEFQELTAAKRIPITAGSQHDRALEAEGQKQ